jgi:hypothetical protein
MPFPTDAGLLVIVPSRGRPESVAKVTEAWRATGAYADARLVFAIDADDPRYAEYLDQDIPDADSMQVGFVFAQTWKPMVHKLNEGAVAAASAGGWGGIAFMGDDHLPRTDGWVGALLAGLSDLGSGIVYGRDGIQNRNLPTWWAMTPDIIRVLGRMVPADVEHLYCDNAIKDLGEVAGCLRYLPEVLIEHMHPVAGKAQVDDGYRRVNSPEQYAKDKAAYARWRYERLPRDADIVRALRADIVRALLEKARVT